MQKKTKPVLYRSQTVDKGHECFVMFVAFYMHIFNEIVEISTLKMIFMV